MTRISATEQETWDAARDAGLMELAPDGKQVIEDHLEIRFCAAEPDDTAGITSNSVA